jgi:hypothetical protein
MREIYLVTSAPGFVGAHASSGHSSVKAFIERSGSLETVTFAIGGDTSRKKLPSIGDFLTLFSYPFCMLASLRACEFVTGISKEVRVSSTGGG